MLLEKVHCYCLLVKQFLIFLFWTVDIVSLTTAMFFTLLAAEHQGRPLLNINSTASQRQQIFDIRCTD